MNTKIATFYRSFTWACAGAVLVMASGASAQNLFVAAYASGEIYEITPGGAQSVFATGMDYPSGVAFDSAGDLFVGNSANNAGESGNITEIAPNGTQSIFASGVDPQGLVFNTAGDLFQADWRSGNIYEYTPGGVQSTFATGLSLPISLAFDRAGDLFVGAGWGNGNCSIIKIAPNGTQSLFASGLFFPQGLAFDQAGNLFEADEGTGTVFEYTPGGVRSTFASVNSANGVAFDNAGDLFVTSDLGPLTEITPGGAQSTVASESGIPGGLAFQPAPEPSEYALLALGLAALVSYLGNPAFNKGE